jgi:hypothetical protein
MLFRFSLFPLFFVRPLSRSGRRPRPSRFHSPSRRALWSRRSPSRCLSSSWRSTRWFLSTWHAAARRKGRTTASGRIPAAARCTRSIPSRKGIPATATREVKPRVAQIFMGSAPLLFVACGQLLAKRFQLYCVKGTNIHQTNDEMF